MRYGLQVYSNCSGQTLVNPYEVALSSRTTSLLVQGPKFCLNIKPSKIDVLACVKKIGASISEASSKIGFCDAAIHRMCRVVDDSYQLDSRNFKAIQLLKKEIADFHSRCWKPIRRGLSQCYHLVIFIKK